MKKFAVILSGCGQYDGTELYEGIYTITALLQSGNAKVTIGNAEDLEGVQKLINKLNEFSNAND